MTICEIMLKWRAGELSNGETLCKLVEARVEYNDREFEIEFLGSLAEIGRYILDNEDASCGS